MRIPHFAGPTSAAVVGAMFVGSAYGECVWTEPHVWWRGLIIRFRSGGSTAGRETNAAKP